MRSHARAERERSFVAVGVVLVGIVAACGSNGDGSVFGDSIGGGGREAGFDPEGSADDAATPGNVFGGPDSGPVGSCVPRSCAQAGVDCGPIGDGCGGVLQCGSCKAPQSCGGGGKASICGGASACVPKTCASLNVNCGPIGDGCGGAVASCGACTSPQICGGGGKPSQCGGGNSGADGGVCVPSATCPAGACGPIANGCGGLIQCGGCTAPQICGGGGVASKCGGSNGCVPKMVCPVGSCGPIADGCGGLIAACNNACTAPKICGGAGVASQCGASSDAGVCTGLCLSQVQCDGGGTTSLSGTVYAPNGTEPLPNAVVYVPNGGPAPSYGVQPFTPGVSCSQCGADITGSPLVKTITGPDGKFTLTNVPVAPNIPLVVQLGRWRRMVTVPTVAACANTAAPATITRLPRNKAEGDIPLFAIALGKVDSLECVLRKIGVDDTEFTPAGGTGRIQMYKANGANAPSWTGATGLIDSLTTLKKFDVVLLPCEGFPDNGPNPLNLNPAVAGVVNASSPPVGVSPRQQAMIDYTNAGGRVYATHYSYTWLANSNVTADGPTPFSGTATFNLNQQASSPVTGDIDTSFPKGVVFAQWLGIVGALSNVSPPKIAINVSRHDMTAVVAPAQRWISVDPTPATLYPGVPQHYTFNTPTTVPPANQCGRVLFSDFHVSNANTAGLAFPSECNPVTPPGPLTAQEKVLEFMIFDLSNCIAPDVAPTCTPKTCAQQGFDCGAAGDGCGNIIQCGACVAPQYCGGGGPSKCGGPTCAPGTCAQLGYNCGAAGDGCGGTLDCGTCAANMICGGGGSPNTCGTPTCTKTTCAALGFTCGAAGDGCGGLLDCGACVAPDTCGGAGPPNQCGHPVCTPVTCAQVGANCGPIADGCGGLINCGTCIAPDTCGGGGTSNVCGGGPR